ncbi:vacuolar amino acid transmembrane transporter Avt5 [Schizosaccharomyces pombe]|uniref:Vacuolar amino acid transporter 5 n=1 Tax=Schizosaccharomyces pombe (strain 972 / ATCC 24843) TaxID=284812 RepID=AVT5_SCHPO|nr:vacuolar amino acid efflux transporter Avt5 [Schizosaccharomyces pombe]O74327.1 RecName: Full=Vacuolar amino acid transporter 5 [Schizosaccharomyces pombe 972h-]CAA20055.1 vacuolar amino acid efflux transporter Avt5 [Schizosaccharomyces pombe]|eukprot:NP_595211.1 vacuolar amino acid efflux transporter Avt5 [Schizosaccharomyces pombe]
MSGYSPLSSGPADVHIGKAGFFSSVINLANTILGAGILSLPNAFTKTGLLFGCLTIVFSAFASFLGLYFVSQCAARLPRGKASFAAVAKHTFPSLAVVFDASIAVKCFGVAVSYLVIVGDLMPQIAPSLGLSSPMFLRRQTWIVFALFVLTPLSFLKRLDSLRHTSVISLIALCYLVFIVLYHFIIGDTVKGEIRYFVPESGFGYLSVLPVFVFGFTCHQNAFSVINEVRNFSQGFVNFTMFTAIISSTLLYLLVAITGYLSFGSLASGNIIAMYDNTSIWIIGGKLAIVVLVLFSYPLQCHPCRNSVYQAIRRSYSAHDMSDGYHAVITLCILLFTHSLALLLSSLEMVLAFVGSTGSTFISFILPGSLYYFFSHKVASPGNSSPLQLRISRAFAAGLAIYGTVVMILCLNINIAKLSH